jgi:bidirectional [NiFe] hydrogenase diaphorase subunit
MTPDEFEKHAVEAAEALHKCKHRVCVCLGTGCMSSGSDQVKAALQAQVKAGGLEGEVEVKQVGCMGLCAAGPLVEVATPSENRTVMYHGVVPDDAGDIVKSAQSGEKVERLNFPTDIPFFTRQKWIVRENSGTINPERIDDYIAVNGYSALLKVVTTMTPAQVIEEVQRSGLRGRGGAGYPTGLKWSMVAKAAGTSKYLVCNADEGDPGAFMNRSVLEADPHRVLEGMAIAAYAVGADHGYIYVRAEYPLAVKRLKLAIQQAERIGVLGNNIFGTPLSFKIELRLGAGAFVCGEETALLASIEGGRGQPRPRPPFPAESGLWGAPTLINNVETYATIAPIIRNGSAWYAGIGTEGSKGTKTFALAGKVVNIGLIEVPFGITLREIIFDIGGGIPDGKKFKAVQTGGPSGGCIPEQFLDMPVDYDSLAKAGSIMGSGGMIIMDETSSMIDVARYFMEFCMFESCGKCVPCRVGTMQMHEILQKFIAGKATPNDLAMLEELCIMVRNTSLCGLGQSAPNPVLTTLRYFRHEYEERMSKDADAREPAADAEIKETA